MAGRKENADNAYDASQEAWRERCSAKETMNREFEAMKSSSEHHQEVWDEYGRVRDYNNSRIESLRSEADYEHQQMCDCFDKASYEYEYGDKSMAPVYSQEGRDHKERRDELNSEISELIREIKDAKQNAEWRAPKTDSSAFHSARETFNRAKEHHQQLEAEFKRLKRERDRLKADFDRLHEEHKRTKAAFQRRLEEVKAEHRREREHTLDKAGVSYGERSDAKIVKKSDGTAQVYHGGLGSGDGYGHGHTVLDQNGQVTYDRNAFAEHGGQNYTNPSGNQPYSGWTPRARGIIIGSDGKDYPVTFREGLGEKDGQTLISDGHVNRKEFNRHHNHYGKNDKSLYPDQPDRIEDSTKHRNDDNYHGPGH